MQAALASLRALAALLLAASLLAPPVRAQTGDPLAEARDVKQWLWRIHEAAGRRNFQGTFVVSAGGSVASSRIVHFSEGANQFERIEALDGYKRQVYRHNDLVHSFWPQSRVALIETRQATSQFPALLSSGAEHIVQFYDVRPVGEGRVAGHDANVLLLRPRDGYRFGYRLWAEKQSGLLLRAEVFDERDMVLEASAFSEVLIGVKPQPELVIQAMKRIEGYRIQRPSLQEVDLAREGWTFRQLPPGFRHVSSVKRTMAAEAADALTQRSTAVREGGSSLPPTVLQAIYSDGLTYVSVFIEAYDAALHRREILMAMGATQTLVQRHGDWWLTVIGDVPVATLRAFAGALDQRR
ncbi:MucB/RseB C-terminal domain-containing protein [Methylibium sp.]|uniref:MucB/RseB C-terminal domain-containing protein n=1 Tax=Methylibium sp. TaxID=2067992 RepID=UPI00286AF5D5|nr:MucB/RseB C-terminal domain-containing protein [Methylibium sp.]